MINFIIEEEKLKEVIDNYMMNYNYTYDIKIYDSYKENNYFNIYILNYDSKNILDINKIKRIRYELDDWSSIIILLIKNDKDKYSHKKGHETTCCYLVSTILKKADYLK